MITYIYIYDYIYIYIYLYSYIDTYNYTCLTCNTYYVYTFIQMIHYSSPVPQSTIWIHTHTCSIKEAILPRQTGSSESLRAANRKDSRGTGHDLKTSPWHSWRLPSGFILGENPRSEWRSLASWKITYFYGPFSSQPCLITGG